MTKYVGKHRKPRKWNRKKTIATSIATAGVLAFPSTPCLAGPREVPDDKPPLPPFTVGLAAPIKAPLKIPKPAPIEEEEITEWVEELVAPDPPVPQITTIQAECLRGPGSAIGLSTNASLVYDTICALFPEVSAFGGFRAGDQDHGTGNAIDCMVGYNTGEALANWLLAHWNDLPLKYIIWQQRISYGGEWQWMEDRGSPTQNHMDHVHISVN